MSYQQDLMKAVLNAFLLASIATIPSDVVARGREDVTLMAAGCGSCGSKNKDKELADNTDDTYQMRSRNYRNTNPNYSSSDADYSTKSAIDQNNYRQNGLNQRNSQASSNTQRMNSELYQSRNSNEAYGDINHTHNDVYESNHNGINQQTGNFSANDMDNGTAKTAGSQETNVQATAQPLTETQLLVALSPQGRAIYMSLDSEAKALAVQLASEKTFTDKNLAVKEAKKRMDDRQGLFRGR